MQDRETLTLLAKNSIAKKSLGQNFLIDPEALATIVDSLDLKRGEPVLEIGPGIGFLTELLIESGAQVTAVELDDNLVTRLKNTFGKKLNVVHKNFLDFDLDEYGPEKFKVVGNIPYHITTPIFTHLFGEVGEPHSWSHKIQKVAMTIQYEVALRLVARPGEKDYSRLTLLSNYFTVAKLEKKLPQDSFLPAPKVRSAIVSLEPLSEPPIECIDLKLLRHLIQLGFGSRRKMLKNTLHSLESQMDEPLDNILRSCGISVGARAEDLSLTKFAALADAVAKAKGAFKQ